MIIRNIAMSVMLGLTTLTVNIANADTPLAKVDGKVITLEQIELIIKSMPQSSGSTGDDKAGHGRKVTQVLRNVVHGELMFLEAKRTGVMESPRYKREASSFRELMMANLYRQKLYSAPVRLEKAMVERFAKERDITTRMATVQLKLDERKKGYRADLKRLYKEYDVKFNEATLVKRAAEMTDGDILATSNEFNVVYGDLKGDLARFNAYADGLRVLLKQVVEHKLFALEAIRQGLSGSKTATKAMEEYKRMLAVKIFRENFNEKRKPSEKEKRAYLFKNKNLLYYPQVANTLKIVTSSKSEAKSIRARAMNGEDFLQLAITHTIVPDPKTAAGRNGMIKIGYKPYTPVDLRLLTLAPGEISEPIKGPDGYCIYKLLILTKRVVRDKKEVAQISEAAILYTKLYEYMKMLYNSELVEIYR